VSSRDRSSSHRQDLDQYRVCDHWEKFVTIHDKVSVRGHSKPALISLRFTRHGPVLRERFGRGSS
jgi:hypothetical protein